MAEKAEVEVKLDTSRAKQALDGLVRQAGVQAKKIGGMISGGIKRGIAATGIDFDVGSQMKSAFSGPTNSAVSDIISEAVTPYANQFMTQIFGDMPVEARAARSARDDLISTFGMTVGRTDTITPGMQAYFNNMKQVKQYQEHGRMVIESNPAFYGQSLPNIIEKVVSSITEAVARGFDRLIESLAPSNWFG
jgi:hypothetical protein